MPRSRANLSTSSMSRKDRFGGGGLARSPVDGQSATRACSRRAWMFAPSSSRHEKSSCVLDEDKGAASAADARRGHVRPMCPREGSSRRPTRAHGTGALSSVAAVAMIAGRRVEDCAAGGSSRVRQVRIKSGQEKRDALTFINWNRLTGRHCSQRAIASANSERRRR